MSKVAETVAVPVAGLGDLASPGGDPRKSHPGTSTVSLQEVQMAVARFLERPSAKTEPYSAPGAATTPGDGSVRQTWTREDVARAAVAAPPPAQAPDQVQDELDVQLTLAVGQARTWRQPVSVVMLAVETSAPLSPEQTLTVDRLLEAACRGAEAGRDAVSAPSPARRVLVHVGRDRQEAVGLARKLVDRLKQMIEPLQRSGQLGECVVAGGVASVMEPPKNFPSRRLLETAHRCLAAALNGGGVKSLEVM
jgi:hypothetical protein